MLELVRWRPHDTRRGSAEPVRPELDPVLLPRDFDRLRSPVSSPILIEQSLAAATFRDSPVQLFLPDPAKSGDPDYQSLPTVTRIEPVVVPYDGIRLRPATGRVRQVRSIRLRLTISEPLGNDRTVHVETPYLMVRDEQPARPDWRLAFNRDYLERCEHVGYDLQGLRHEMARELVLAAGDDAVKRDDAGKPDDGARTAVDRALTDAGLLAPDTPITLERWRGPGETASRLRADVDPDKVPLVLNADVHRKLLDDPHLELTLAYACRHHNIALELHLPDDEYRGNRVYENLQRITGIDVERTPHGRADLDGHEHGEDLHGSITVRLSTRHPDTGADDAIRIDTPFAFLGECSAHAHETGFVINLGAAHVPDTPEIREQIVQDMARILFQYEDTPVYGDAHVQQDKYFEEARETVAAVFQAAGGEPRERQQDDRSPAVDDVDPNFQNYDRRYADGTHPEFRAYQKAQLEKEPVHPRRAWENLSAHEWLQQCPSAAVNLSPAGAMDLLHRYTATCIDEALEDHRVRYPDQPPLEAAAVTVKAFAERTADGASDNPAYVALAVPVPATPRTLADTGAADNLRNECGLLPLHTIGANGHPLLVPLHLYVPADGGNSLQTGHDYQVSALELNRIAAHITGKPAHGEKVPEEGPDHAYRDDGTVALRKPADPSDTWNFKEDPPETRIDLGPTIHDAPLAIFPHLVRAQQRAARHAALAAGR